MGNLIAFMRVKKKTLNEKYDPDFSLQMSLSDILDISKIFLVEDFVQGQV